RGTKPVYASLRQPPFAPPAWLFAPAWTTLYGLMGYAVYHASTLLLSYSSTRSKIQTLYTIQLILNHLWMPLFFGLRRPALAAVDMAALGGSVALLMRVLWDADRVAFWLLVPYAGWLGYAAYLNVGVGWLNGWRVDGGGEGGGKGGRGMLGPGS
ncbi:TspO/MBR-related protein, partial [Aspergillus pseudoustus]